MGTYPHWTHVIMGSSYDASPNDGVFRNASHRYSEGDLYTDKNSKLFMKSGRGRVHLTARVHKLLVCP